MYKFSYINSKVTIATELVAPNESRTGKPPSKKYSTVVVFKDFSINTADKKPTLTRTFVRVQTKLPVLNQVQEFDTDSNSDDDNVAQSLASPFIPYVKQKKVLVVAFGSDGTINLPPNYERSSPEFENAWKTLLPAIDTVTAFRGVFFSGRIPAGSEVALDSFYINGIKVKNQFTILNETDETIVLSCDEEQDNFKNGATGSVNGGAFSLSSTLMKITFTGSIVIRKKSMFIDKMHFRKLSYTRDVVNGEDNGIVTTESNFDVENILK